MNPAEIADVLDGAADLIWVRGRTTGQGVGPSGERCMAAAIADVLITTRGWVNLGDESYQIGAAVNRHPREHEMDPPWMTQWNDSLPVNAENDELVIDTLKRCAKSLRESACS